MKRKSIPLGVPSGRGPVMSYKTILVSLNEIGRVEFVLEATARLAIEYSSHVVGLYVIPAPMFYSVASPYLLPELIDTISKSFEEASMSVKQKFETVMKRNGINYEWRLVRARVPIVSEPVCEEGRAADLVVISDIDREASFGVELYFVESVVVGSGGPVLILPRKGENDFSFNQIVCGYNGSKEAARALRDALPLLKKAQDVRLIWVDPSLDEPAAGAVPGAEMAESLNRHNVKTTVDPMPTGHMNPAEALMLRARDLGAGLIVAGAYGHTRIREFVLGGATRYALSSVEFPLMMSH